MKLNAPYDQCLSSRRFMLSREPKSLPSTALMVSIAGSSGFALGGATSPAMSVDLLGARPVEQVDLPASRLGATSAMFFVGTSPGRQPAKSRSSLGRISAIVVAPTTTIVAWLGLNQVLWNFTRSSRVIFLADASVPEPLQGLA